MKFGLLNLRGLRRLPVLLQAETAECGLACIGMVSSWHGRREDLVSLRQRFGIGSRGATLNGLIQIATALGLTTRAIKCEVKELETLSTPAILHWDFNHFVVLREATSRAIDIHDPAVGARRYTPKEFGNHFTGIALEISPGDGFTQEDVRRKVPLLSFFTNLRAIIPSLGQILLLSALLQVVALATPFYMQLVVDEVLVKHDTDLLTLLGAGFLGLTLFSVLTQAIRGWAGIYLTHQLSFVMGAKLFQRLLSLPVQFFTRRQMGDIVSRFGSLKPIQDFLTSSTIAVLLDGVMAITTLTMMYLYSPTLGWIVVASLILYLILQLAFYLPIKQRNHESIVSEARTDSNFMESIRAIDAIKRFAVETTRVGDWQNRFSDAINTRVRVDRLGLALDLFCRAVSGVANVLVIFVGARQVLAGEMSIGMLYAFMSYRTHLTSSVTSLVNEYVKFLMLSLHLERLSDIQLEEPEQSGAPPLPLPVDGKLELQNAAFRYSNMDPWIFRELSLTIEPGESVAVFGPSGCGKSTLLCTLQRSLVLEQGQLLLDDTPVSVSLIPSLRRASASVMQGDCLLSGSISSNITFGEPWPDPARTRRAAEAACIHDDISRLPMGYESLVGEMGTSLSAGQVQRILIARALYHEPTILFLDEGTAHLDKETERRVMKNIVELSITCVFITHNKSMLGLADKVVLMDTTGHSIRRVTKRIAA